MVASDSKYFENGFLVLSTNGTNGDVILGLSDVSLKYSVDVQELLVFDNNFSKVYSPTFQNWTVSCSGEWLTLSGATGKNTHPSSGSTILAGSQSGAQLLETAKTRATNLRMILRLDNGNFQRGNVIITSYEYTANAGEPAKYSLELQGTGALTRTTT